MTDQAIHRPDQLDSPGLCYDNLPSLKELLDQLDHVAAVASTSGKEVRWRQWYSNPKLKAYVLPNFFPLLYMLAVLTWALVVGLHLRFGALSELIQHYGIHVLHVLFFFVMIQFMWNAVGLAQFYFNLSSNYISSVQSQMVREDLLAYRLKHLPSKSLRRCRERVELEIEANDKTKFAVAVLPAIPILLQISMSIRDKSDRSAQELHCQQVQPEPRPKPSSSVSSWSVSLATAIVVLIFLDLFFVRMGRQLKRLAHVLNCAETEYGS